ncbi:hypothetical protein CSA80_01190 [Candidatus Saccharibacteria bacterium]|nr:MAG: hypothetical protein CR973_01965 [Candidatus Saccharibacteria bacterium]PID99362.1 MAG: hypothetical protein CSA80_01190 [Candidatus Saccharibacteria bacterium]
MNRATKLKLRRSMRNRQRRVENAAQRAEASFDSHFIDRLERLLDVKRFVAGWLFLVITISILTLSQTVNLRSFYSTFGPVAGGTFNEGMLGAYSNANPIYATGAVDTAASRLLFAGLLKYDEHNRLVGDLARDYTVDKSGKKYTFTLKPNLRWHDGARLTSKDVVFTFKTIQNPDTRSPLLTSWQGIVVSAPNDKTVVFTLPSALTAFPHSLTLGIIPQHLLRKIPAAQLRTSSFNTTQPVGAGPFEWDSLQFGKASGSGEATALLSFTAFENYNGGRAKLDGLVLHVYDDTEKLVAAYKKKTIEAVAGLKNLPKTLENDSSIYRYRFNTTTATMLFFKTSDGFLKDAAVRRALVLGTDRQRIRELINGSPRPVNQPLLIGQLGYAKEFDQSAYDPNAAAKALEQAGWLKAKNGIRQKDKKPLSILVVAEEKPENERIMKSLQEMWRGIGVELMYVLRPPTDFQSSVETHSYTALLYTISIGVDPDVYAYWSSTQADPRSSNRLNLSEYKSAAVDAALEGGRTRQDPLVRELKYKAFLKAWQKDAPAIGLYQPQVLYISRGMIDGLSEHAINTDADRYYSVTNWTVKIGQIPK